MTLPVIDVHAHLNELKDVHSALKEAREAGVEGVVAVSMDLGSCRRNLEISRRYMVAAETSRVRLALGIHPSEIKIVELEESFKFIEENAAAALAIGEIGLDFWDKDARKDKAVRDRQAEVFGKMIDMTLALQKPVIVHSRGAWNECFETLRGKNAPSALFHWYSGPLDVLKKIMEAGYFISVTPALEYSKDLIAAVKAAPLDRIMIETDTPVYGWKPVDVLKSMKLLAGIKGVAPEVIASATTTNAKKFFGDNL